VYRVNSWLLIFFSDYIARDAEGSGVPEMKAILAGVHLHNFLSLKTLIGKWIGLLASIGGSLSIGRQGGYIHMACCIAH
jgi:H+/Cl- antiporter ClcA